MKQRRFILIALSFLYIHTQASRLDVYTDKSLYAAQIDDVRLGLVSLQKAQCDWRDVAFEATEVCPEKYSLCKIKASLRDTQAKLFAVRTQIDTLDTIRHALKTDELDAEKWIAAAQRTSQKLAALHQKKDNLDLTLQQLKNKLSIQTTAPYPIRLTRPCDSKVILTFRSDAIRFSTFYKALLDQEGITVQQFLKVTNRSGMDIKADEAYFYNFPTSQYVRAPRFTPLMLSDAPLATYRTMQKRLKANIAAANPSKPLPKITKDKARTYRIASLKLPSDGIPKAFKVTDYHRSKTCRNEWYAYGNQNHALYVCRFQPRDEIENHRWQVIQNGHLVNDNALGRYEANGYALYVRRIPDLYLKRTVYVPDKKEDGFFNTTLTKKEGHVLTVTNASNKKRTLRILERIPVSTTDKIKVKLLPIKGIDGHFRKDENGKIDFDVTLQAGETKTVSVLYTVSHPKDIKVYRR